MLITKEQTEEFDRIINYLITIDDLDRFLDSVPDKVKVTFINDWNDKTIPEDIEK